VIIDIKGGVPTRTLATIDTDKCPHDLTTVGAIRWRHQLYRLCDLGGGAFCFVKAYVVTFSDATPGVTVVVESDARTSWKRARPAGPGLTGRDVCLNCGQPFAVHAIKIDDNDEHWCPTGLVSP